jgi:hypothetical protein
MVGIIAITSKSIIITFNSVFDDCGPDLVSGCVNFLTQFYSTRYADLKLII